MQSYNSARYMTPKQVSYALGISEKRLCIWRKQNKGPPFIIRASRIFYPSRLLDAWIKRGEGEQRETKGNKGKFSATQRRLRQRDLRVNQAVAAL